MTPRRKHRLGFMLFFALPLLLPGCTPMNSASPTHSVTIVNQSSHNICSVKFYPSGAYLIHAKNVLRSSVFKKKIISAGQTDTVTVPEGLYDIRIKTCDGLVTGTDYFSVPSDAPLSITDEKLIKPVR